LRLAEFKMRLFVFFADRLLRWAGPVEHVDAKTSPRKQPAPALNNERETTGPPEHWTRLIRSTPPQHWLDLFPGKALEFAVEGEIAGDEIVAGEVSTELFSTEIPGDGTERGLDNLAGFANDEPSETLSDEVPKRRRNDPRYPAVSSSEKSWLDRLHFPAPPPRPIAEARPSGRAIPAREPRSDSTLIYPSTAKERAPESDASDETFVESSGRQPRTNSPLETRKRSDPSLTVGLLPRAVNDPNKTSYPENAADGESNESSRERSDTNYPQPKAPPRGETLRFTDRPGPSSRREAPKPESTINSSSTTRNWEATTFVEDAPRSPNKPSFQDRARQKGSILEDFGDNKPAQPKLQRNQPAVVAQSVAKAAEPRYVERSSAARTSSVRPTPAARSRSVNQPAFIDSARPDRTFSVSNSETPIDSNDDRWPALPPPPLFEMTDELFLREAELRSLRRIDREQRGVLWNE
jgi:hypothetical protein